MKFFTTCFLSAFAAAGILSATPVVTADLLNPGTALADKSGNLVGPYTLSVNGVSYAALCVDFSDTGVLNKTYSAYETQLSSGNLSNTYNPTFTTQYAEEAYLMTQILKPGADRIDIQDAAWAITDSAYKASSAAQTYINLAQANYTTVDLRGFDVISDLTTGCNRSQEFLIDPGVSSVAPEPGTVTMLLMGLGLLGAGVARRRKTAKV